MKESKYNSVIPLGSGRILVYNAFTDKCMLIRNAKEFKGLRHLYGSSEGEAAKLEEIGAFVEDDKDEIAAVRDVINQTDKDDSWFMLHVNPTLDCNFNCWYCYEKHQKGSMMSEEMLSHTVQLIANRIEALPDLKYFHLAFFGGEPLLGYEKVVKPLILEASERCKERGIEFDVSFTSNGYLVTPGIVDFLKRYECSFQITLDGGKEAHDKVRFGQHGAPSFDRIIDNIRLLVESGIRCVCRINYTSENIESTSGIIDALKRIEPESRKHLKVDYQRVWQDRPASEFETARDVEIDDIVRGRLKELRQEGFMVSFHKPLGGIWDSCYADKKNQILVNFNGDVFSCTARDFSPESRSGHLTEGGEVEWREEYMAKRLDCKFIKALCHECRIAPLCGGGCRQQAMEHYESGDCIYGYSEGDKDNIVLNRFENLYL